MEHSAGTAKPIPSLCVVVCVHNATDYAEICIDSVLRHTPKPYHLVLVNDGSSAKASELLKTYAARYDHVQLIVHETAQGYTKAANRGLHASRADYTILLNSDTIVSPQWAQRIIACGESDKRIGIIGPLSNAATYQSVPYVFDDRGRWKQNELTGNVTVADYARLVADAAVPDYPRVPVANGFCFTVKRSVIDSIGYLDEETFPRGYGEENDYCIRAADAGFELAIADDAYVFHAVSRSFGVGNREELTRTAHFAIRAKHSEERLGKIDHALRNDPAMEQVRHRIRQHELRNQTMPGNEVRHALSLYRPNQGLRILFLLPDCGAKSGGTQLVVELTGALRRMGVVASIAAKRSIKQEYDHFFAGTNAHFFYYEKPEELLEQAKNYDLAVATIFHSITLLRDIVKKYPNVKPAYFVQDYEPWFLDEYPKLRALAEQSYTMVANNHLIAISPFVCDTLRERHQLNATKIWGSVDHDLFYPDLTRKQEKLMLSAMVRPSTPWRGPKQTMLVLQQLAENFGDKIDIHIFGCSKEELAAHELPAKFAHTNHGGLGRYEVANLLRQSDIFLDLSVFQAFGRTALEAMACGAALVAPVRGGVHDFASDGKNALLVDTENSEACVAAASTLIEDAALRHRLRAAGLETALEYSLFRSALSFLRAALAGAATR